MTIPPDRNRRSGAVVPFTFRAPKAGETLDDCQDAFCSTDNMRYAVADGVGQSMLPAEWATILVKHACQRGAPESKSDFAQWLAPALQLWNETRRRIVAARPSDYWISGKSPIAASTLMLLDFHQSADQKELLWSAFGVGDSCLFHVRDGKARLSLPLQHWNDFGRRPPSISTVSSALPPHIMYEDGLRDGDRFLLATDALSKWVCKEMENGRAPFAVIDSLRDEQDFCAFLAAERTTQRMDNDDVTLLWLKPAAPPPELRSAPSSRAAAPFLQNPIAATVVAVSPPQSLDTSAKVDASAVAAMSEIPEMRKVLLVAAIVSAFVSITMSAIFNVGLRQLRKDTSQRTIRQQAGSKSSKPLPAPQPSEVIPNATPVTQTEATAESMKPPAPLLPAATVKEGWIICPWEDDCKVSGDGKSVQIAKEKTVCQDWNWNSDHIGKVGPGVYPVRKLHTKEQWALIDLTPSPTEKLP